MFFEFFKFIFYSAIIVVISKFVLVTTLRKLAESLNLKPKTIGNMAGVATSVPELLTITVSSFSGLASASIFNVLSSNVINLLQYLVTVISNKNIKLLKNKAIKVDIILVVLTILIPLFLVIFKIEINVIFIPIFIMAYFIFKFLNDFVHKLYLKKDEEELDNIIEREEEYETKIKKNTIKYIGILLLTTIILFIIGELLGNVLENLANIFNISQLIIGILLGIITSIPELITFFESQKHYKTKNSNMMLGLIEATNNLFMSNILNLFIIQTIGILIYIIV